MNRIWSFLAPVLLAALLALDFGVNLGTVTAAEKGEASPGADPWCCDAEPSPAWRGKEAPPPLVPRAERHRTMLQAGVPVEYRARRSPYPVATKVIRDGGALYLAQCAACHGLNGLGDGDAGRDLTPSPALLAYLIENPRSVDEYLLWTISEGGASFGTEMPAYKGTLTDRQIWQIVTYMRSGFPPFEAGQPD